MHTLMLSAQRSTQFIFYLQMFTSWDNLIRNAEIVNYKYASNTHQSFWVHRESQGLWF